MLRPEVAPAHPRGAFPLSPLYLALARARALLRARSSKGADAVAQLAQLGDLADGLDRRLQVGALVPGRDAEARAALDDGRRREADRHDGEPALEALARERGDL